MFFTYILFSNSNQEYYVGHTNSIDIRIEKHNAGEVISTKHAKPWRIVTVFEFETRSEAMKLEKKIKKRGINRYLQNINFGA